MIRVKHPIEYELTPDSVERGSHWLTVRIKNTGDNDLKNINIKMHSLDSLHISFHNPNHYIYDLESNEENRVQKFDSNGKFITKWGIPSTPLDVAVDSKGLVYVVDGPNHQIEVYGPSSPYTSSSNMTASK